MKYEIRFPLKPQGSYRWARRARCVIVRSDHPHKICTRATMDKTWWCVSSEVDLRSRKQIVAANDAAEQKIKELSAQ